MRRIETFASLSIPDFRTYLIGIFGQMAAQNMQLMVRSLLVYRITGSASSIGIMAIAGTVPHIISALYGGVIADRFQKKYILVISLAVLAAISLGIGVSLTTGWLNERTWWLLVVTSASQATLMGILIPARHSIIPDLVGRERLMNAISLNSLGQNSWRLMAPAAAGFLVEGFGFEAVYYIIGGLYIWALVFMCFVPPTARITADSKNALAEIVEGFRYLGKEPGITWVLIFNLFAVMLSMPYLQLLPVFVDDILKVGAGGMGIMISVSGIGAIVGSLILASLPNKRRGLFFLTITIFLGLVLIVFSFSRSWALSLVIMAFIGLGHTGRLTLSNTLVQHYSADRFRGRVMGIYDMQMSFPGLSVYVAGLLTGIIGVDWAVGGFAILLVAISVVILLTVPSIRRLD